MAKSINIKLKILIKTECFLYLKNLQLKKKIFIKWKILINFFFIFSIITNTSSEK
jgi:hypothetical protein